MCIGPDGGEIGILVQEKELARVEPGEEEGRKEGRSTALLESWLGSASQIPDCGVDSASVDISHVLFFFLSFSGFTFAVHILLSVSTRIPIPTSHVFEAMQKTTRCIQTVMAFLEHEINCHVHVGLRSPNLLRYRAYLV